MTTTTSIPDDRLFKIVCLDAGVFTEVPYVFIKKCKTLLHMIEDFGGDTDTPLPIHNMASAFLARVIAFSHLPELPQPKEGEEAPKVIPIDPNPDAPVSQQRAFFKDMPQAELFEIILAANYLDYRALLDAACRTVSEMIRGKTTEEIRKTFNIKNDFTPEEEAQVMRENEWAEEQ